MYELSGFCIRFSVSVPHKSGHQLILFHGAENQYIQPEVYVLCGPAADQCSRLLRSLSSPRRPRTLAARVNRQHTRSYHPQSWHRQSAKQWCAKIHSFIVTAHRLKLCRLILELQRCMIICKSSQPDLTMSTSVT